VCVREGKVSTYCVKWASESLYSNDYLPTLDSDRMMRKEQPWLLVTSPSKLLVFLVFVLQPKECSPDLACSQPLQALKIGGGVGYNHPSFRYDLRYDA
jgi:hypothetical protein